MCDVPSFVPRAIDVIEGNLMGERVRMDSIPPHKLFTEEQRGGSIVHHSRYSCATIPTSKTHHNFEMGTQ